MPGTTEAPKPLPAWFVLVALACTGVYATTFAGRTPIWSRLNAVAFADSVDYVRLLDNGHYRACIAGATHPRQAEHQRKTIHHVLHLAVAETLARSLSALPGLDPPTAVWLVSPIVGGVNVLLAAAFFRRSISSSRLAWACALVFPFLPGTWVYASIPESWALSTTAVLLIANLRVRRWPAILIGPLIGVLALSNFLLLLTVPLAVQADAPGRWLRELIVAGLTAVAAWVAALTVLGLTMSPAFFPLPFLVATFAFKSGFTENLPLLHPARWAYNGANVLALPFVLNQQVLNFGRMAILDSAMRLPLGTAAVAALGAAWLGALAEIMRRVRAASLAVTLRDASLDGELVYLALAFVATGVALYYESFLYATMMTPILLAVLARASERLGPPGWLVWTVVAVWVLNAAQQIATFRSLLDQSSG